MVRKRRNLSDEIARNMEGLSIGAATTTKEVEEVTLEIQRETRETRNTTKRYKSNIVSIRFDEGDYERLKELAQEQGTNGAALIRKAVKDLIKAAALP
jgi:predicted transcriptional regulator